MEGCQYHIDAQALYKVGKSGDGKLNRYFFCVLQVYIRLWKTLWKMCKTLKIKQFTG